MPDHWTKFSLGFALWEVLFSSSLTLSITLFNVYIQPFSYDCHGTWEIGTLSSDIIAAEILIRNISRVTNVLIHIVLSYRHNSRQNSPLLYCLY